MKKAIACCLFLTAMTLSAQGVDSPSKSLSEQLTDSIIKSEKIITIGASEASHSQEYADSVRQLVEQFYFDQFRHFQDPDAPYFLFLSRDAKLAMGVGGTVRMRGYFDWDGAIQSPGFAPYLIPMTPDPTKMRQFATTPAGTCLFFRVIGNNKSLGNYQLYIEANFNGYESRDFKLKKAYAIVNDFTVGYASSTFSDPAAVPATVDAQGPNNKLDRTAILVRWMPRVKKNWVFAVSAETPSTAIDADEIHTKAVDNWTPDGAAFIQYEWGRTSHVRLAGIVRALSYRDLVTQKNHYKAGWGLQLSAVGHPASPLTLFGTASYGKGYAGLSGDLGTGQYDLIGDPDTPGFMYAPAFFGWNIGVQYNFTPSVFVSTSFSQSRFLPSKTVDSDEYRYGLYGDVNIFWNITPRIQVAAEFDYGMRKDFNGESRWAKRLGALVQFSF